MYLKVSSSLNIFPKRFKFLSVSLLTFIVITSLIYTKSPTAPLVPIAVDHSHYAVNQDFNIVQKPIVAGEDFEFMDAIMNDEDHVDKVIHVINELPGTLDNSTLDDVSVKLNIQNTFKTFIGEIFSIIDKAKPTVGSINNDEHYPRGKIPVYGGHLREDRLNEPIRNEEYLNFLKLNEEEIAALSVSHASVIENLPDSFPEGVLEGTGIVYVGGGKFDWLVLLSIQLLRKTGSILPVEVVLPVLNDFHIDLCNRVLPALNAKCIIMTDYLPPNIRVSGYQLKSVAIMISSFERVLYLDSDSLPIKNPDLLLINEPFLTHGLISWPDFWRRSTAPAFYNISKIPVELRQERFSYHDDRNIQANITDVSYHDLKGAIPECSSETGQLLINKQTHAKSLLLSLYYNVYGPHYYYALLSQGAAGEGDKETFLSAAHKLGQSYYQVKEFIREFGMEHEDGKHEILAMGQYDPIIDFIQSHVSEVSLDYDAKKTSNYNHHFFKHSELLFLHANWPKLNPLELSGREEFRNIKDSKGNRQRLYTKSLIDEVGYDYELRIWTSMEWLLCEHPDIKLNGWDKNRVRDGCNEVREQITFLRYN